MSLTGSLSMFENFQKQGFTEEQARLLTETFVQQAEAQQVAFQKQVEAQHVAFEKHAVAQKANLDDFAKEWDEKQRRDLATKRDLREVELRLLKEIEVTRSDLRETELRLLKEIENVRKEIAVMRGDMEIKLGKFRYDLLRWQIGIGIAICLILAKGFGWLGF